MTAKKVVLIEGGATQFRPARSESGTYVKTSPWTDRDEVLLRHEAEIRYRERTPPRSGEEQDPDRRVPPEEMLDWAEENLNKSPRDPHWEIEYREWYVLMVSRNPVHLQWLDRYALCGAKGEMPPLKTLNEHKITCQNCKDAFGNPEEETN